MIIALILITIGGLCGYLNGEVNLRETIYANPFLFWIAGVSACYRILILVRNMYDYCKKSILVLRLVERIGQYSIVYLCLNQFAILVISVIANKLVGGIRELPLFILTMFMLTIFELVIRNTNIAILFGLKNERLYRI